MPRWWFDAHLDLAYLAVRGRDMLSPLDALREPTEGPDPPAAVTLPSLRDGHVKFALATIFTEPVLPEGGTRQPLPLHRAGRGENQEARVADAPCHPELTAEQYVADDAERAHRRGRAQLEVYLTWAERGLITLDLNDALREDPGVGELRGGMGVAELVPTPLDARVAKAAKAVAPHFGILIENADPVRSPDDLAWWAAHGVVAIGLCWGKPSRYAFGNTTPPDERTGITSLGRDFVREMDRLGILHDASHLSDRSFADLLDLTDRPIIASHSNCRALIDRPGWPPNQRHLTDAAIREIARRGGVVGLNLCSPFLIRGGLKDRRATIDEALAHVERVCELTGSTHHIGLGSDIDGGFSAEKLPAGIDRPADLRRLAEGFVRRGWTPEQVDDFAWRNWARVFAA